MDIHTGYDVPTGIDIWNKGIIKTTKGVVFAISKHEKRYTEMSILPTSSVRIPIEKMQYFVQI